MATKNPEKYDKETERADVFDTPASTPESRMSFREFVDTLSGTDKLLSAGMKIDYTGKKMTLTEWKKAFDEFANTPV